MLDVLLMTKKNFRDINQPIAGLVVALIKGQERDYLWALTSAIRKVHAGYRGAVTTEEREYKPQYFPLYKSHNSTVICAEVQLLTSRANTAPSCCFRVPSMSSLPSLCIWALWALRKAKKPTKSAPPVDVSSLPKMTCAAFPRLRQSLKA